MAYTSIKPIRSTLSKAYAYASGDKEKDGAKFKTLSSGINTTVGTAAKTSEAFETAAKSKRGGRAFSEGEIKGWHIQQDFLESPKELPPQKAHEIGLKLAGEMFPGFVCVVGTHANTEHVHNHIVVGAWGSDLKKLNNNHAFYRKLRTASDRICEENGLYVTEETRKQTLVKYKDTAGRPRYHEPTDRKRRLRENAQNRYAKTSDYRNTKAHETAQNKSEGYAKRIAKDIDRLVPQVSSFYQLTERLRDAGYFIKAKKSDGRPLAHVSYKAPGQSRAIRDKSLGDGGYYTREALEKTIAQLATERLKAQAVIAQPTKKRRSDYLSESISDGIDALKAIRDFGTAENINAEIKKLSSAEAKTPLTAGEKLRLESLLSARANIRKTQREQAKERGEIKGKEGGGR